MESVQEPPALDRVTPARFWGWAIGIAVVGIAVRGLWFWQYDDVIPNAFAVVQSGHYWALPPAFRAPVSAGSLNPYELTRAFAPGYGGLLHAIVTPPTGQIGNHSASVALLMVQSVLAAFSTLLTFALARRVLFGWTALVPVVLVTLSIALIERPGGVAPEVLLMFLMLAAIWLLVVLQERLELGSDNSRLLLLTLATGLTFGLAVLVHPGVLIVLPLIVWWSARGLGREHATLLLVAAVLLPGCWLAVAGTQIPGGAPWSDAQTWVSDHRVDSVSDALERGYAVATPWNARFARGAYTSYNWNYEWILPLSVRQDTTYLTASRVIAGVFMVGYVLLALLGAAAMLLERAGSVARLLALPLLTFPLLTFLVDDGNLLRVAVLPYLAIAITLGALWIAESVSRHGQKNEMLAN